MVGRSRSLTVVTLCIISWTRLSFLLSALSKCKLSGNLMSPFNGRLTLWKHGPKLFFSFIKLLYQAFWYRIVKAIKIIPVSSLILIPPSEIGKGSQWSTTRRKTVWLCSDTTMLIPWPQAFRVLNTVHKFLSFINHQPSSFWNTVICAQNKTHKPVGR